MRIGAVRVRRFAGACHLIIIGGVCTVAVWARQDLPAQGRDESPRAGTSLALGSLPAPPGGQVFVPIVLSHSEAQLCTIISEITYSGDLLSFQGISKGPVTEPGGADVEAAVSATGLDGVSSVLKVSVTCRLGEGLPDGTLAYLEFKVADQAPFGEIELRHAASASGVAAGPQSLQPLTARGGTIEVKVSDNPFHACFFYMH